jgi:hypothetical protein
LGETAQLTLILRISQVLHKSSTKLGFPRKENTTVENLHHPQNLANQHNLSHSSPALHEAGPHGGVTRGSEQESEKHQASKRESEPLVHHLKTSDWQEHAVKHKASTAREKGHLPGLDISDHSKLEQSLSNTSLAPADRLEAARHLVKDGVHSMQFKDQQGKDHDYHIQLFNSGKVKVTEGGQDVFQAGGQVASQERHESAGKQPNGQSRPSIAPEASGGQNNHENPGNHANQISQNSHENPDNHANQISQNNHGNPDNHASQISQNSHASRSVEVAGGKSHHINHAGGHPKETHTGYKSSPVTAFRNGDGSVSLTFNGCSVDTDGHGARRHTEDGHRRSITSLTRSDGKYLDTDKDNFVVLSPSQAAQYGVHVGDLGTLTRMDTGQSVPVVFGDTGHEGRPNAEASVAALRALHFPAVTGNNGVEGIGFKITLARGSGNGRGDIARNPVAIADRLQRRTVVASD